MMTTIIFAAFIIAFFLYIAFQVWKLRRIESTIKKVLETNDVLASLSDTKFSPISESYRKSFKIKDGSTLKTNIPASEYFNNIEVFKCFSLNQKMLDSASGTLVGMGLLGTFLGLTIGISGFDSSNSENIQNSIESLLSGMATAFITSLVGMLLSIIYTIFLDKPLRSKYTRALQILNNKLDESYYIDDLTVMKIQQTELFNDFANNLREHLTYKSESGDYVPISNAVREILRESSEQSKALKSFSTDLALELNQGFDESLSRQMQEKIVPLMENIDQTTKVVIEHIDKMSDNVASPATEMIQNVVDELKSSMTSIMKEFSQGLSGSATHQLEKLAIQLGTAAQSMADFPKNMENISTTLQTTIQEVKAAIAEITDSTAVSSESALKQMQEQISYATTSMSNAIEDVKEIMTGLTKKSEESGNQMVSRLADASERMSTFLNGIVSSLSSSVQASMKSITDDVNDKQLSLLALQEDTTSQTKKLLETFNTAMNRLERINENVAGTMRQFQEAQGQINGSTAHLQTITSDMKTATEVFKKGQNDYTSKMLELQQVNSQNMDKITELLLNSGSMSEEYVEKFETIRNGLSSIFTQLQAGLTEYSLTVQKTTQKYLEQYSTSLTSTTDALSSTIQQQNEVVEMLVESLNSRRK